jgi:hypothetical protein
MKNKKSISYKSDFSKFHQDRFLQSLFFYLRYKYLFQFLSRKIKYK